MVPRRLEALLRDRLRKFPAVALVGPRQAGKTTLARSFSPLYFDLEQEEDRLRLDIEWNAVMASRQLAILDEAQAWPDVFPRLRGAIDRNRGQKGRFLLLGSISPALMKNVSESLAGRLAVCELTPFLVEELPKTVTPEALWFYGGYPEGGTLDPSKFPVWLQEYLRILAQRDLPLWGLPAAPQTTERLFKMLALSHGQIWNASNIGRSLGLTYHTVNSYIDYLVNTFLIRLLPPYSGTLRKRLVKSPKVYWRDSGLLHAQLGLKKRGDLLSQPWVGASWEGWVIEQILSHLTEHGLSFDAFYVRTQMGEELDLLLELATGRWAIEIKLTSAPGSGDLKSLSAVADLVKAPHRVLLSRVSTPRRSDSSLSCSLEHFLPIVLDAAA